MDNALARLFDSNRMLPFREFPQLQESLDRLYKEIMDLKVTNGAPDFSFSPSCEITENEAQYTLRFDLPGVTKDQVKVEAIGDQLTVRAERKEEKKAESERRYLSEVHYGAYARRFTLPSPIDEKKVEAKFENGVLTVTVPKSEGTHSRRIPIH